MAKRTPFKHENYTKLCDLIAKTPLTAHEVPRHLRRYLKDAEDAGDLKCDAKTFKWSVDGYVSAAQIAENTKAV